MKETILFIAPRFYFYHDLIKERLERLGYDVELVEERYYGWKYLLLKFLGHRIFEVFSNRRFSKILSKYKRNFNKLFIIRGESVTTKTIENIKKKNPGIQTILYQWDSVKNHDYRYLIPLFDKIYSFDIKDCQKLNIEYHPLFFTDDSIEIRKFPNNGDIDLLMISTYLPERIPYIRDLISYAKRNNLNLYYYIYITKFTYWKNKIFNKKFLQGLNIHFSPLSKKELIEKYKQANAIIDISNKGQSGLSMRVIETLGSDKKIITTNKLINNQIKINDDQVQIINDINDISMSFLKKPAPKGHYDELYIDNWLRSLL